MFISLYVVPQCSDFPLSLWVGFHSLLEIPEWAEDHRQPKSQTEADAYLIIHADGWQWPFVHGFSYVAEVPCRATWARRVGAEGT